MSNAQINDINDARNYLESIALPPAPIILEAGEEEIVPVVFEDAQAMAVGSQLTDFDQKVPADLRSSISNCALLAQLAANKASDRKENPGQWYDKFAEVFSKLGWVVGSSSFQEQEITDTDAKLHEAIMPLIMTLLGPQAAAASIVLSVLKGLQQMDEESPWMVLFDRESRRFEARHFQYGFADMDELNRPKISILLFELEAEKITTQFLFFKFTDASSALRQKTTTLNIDPSRLQDLKPDLDAKLNSYVTSYIKSIDI